jgi:hypothetical protein
MKRALKYTLGTIGGVALVGIGAAIGSSGSHTVTAAKTATVVNTASVVKTQDVPVPGQTKTVTVKVPVPGPTKTVTKTVTVKVPVPGPTETVTKEVPAPPPPQGSVIDTFSGSGNQVTPAFNVPDGGDYIVLWSYSGNVDTSFGTNQAANFAITETGGGIGLDLPNDIASSGSGSTEVTGANSSDRLNVQATGQWAITIKSA